MRRLFHFLVPFLFIILLLSILYAFAMFQGGFVSWFLFFSFLPISIYHVGLLFYPIKRWQVTRVLSSHIVRAGDRATVTIQLKRNLLFPLYYFVCEDVLSESLNSVHRNLADDHSFESQPLYNSRPVKKMLFPLFRREMNYTYTLENVARGKHTLRAIRVKTGDIFGFINKEFTFHKADELIVYPNEYHVQLNNHLHNNEHGNQSAPSLPFANGNIVTGVREYVPGDKVGWIDWKQTARKGQLMTKQYDHEKSMNTLFILDSCYYEAMNQAAFEAAISILFSFIGTINQEISNVGLISIGDKTVSFPLRNDFQKMARIRQHLTEVQPIKERNFSMLLSEALHKYGDPSSNLVIMSTHLDEGLLQSVKQINHQTKQITLLLAQSSQHISKVEKHRVEQLNSNGIRVSVITEKEFMTSPIEVSI